MQNHQSISYPGLNLGMPIADMRGGDVVESHCIDAKGGSPTRLVIFRVIAIFCYHYLRFNTPEHQHRPEKKYVS